MNRLVPLIERPSRTPAAFAFPAKPVPVALETTASWLDHARLFAAGWVGGLVVFGAMFA